MKFKKLQTFQLFRVVKIDKQINKYLLKHILTLLAQQYHTCGSTHWQHIWFLQSHPELHELFSIPSPYDLKMQKALEHTVHDM